MFDSIKNSSSWSKIDKIAKGWSKDEKFHIVTQDGEQLLLRISDISLYDQKQAELEIVKKYSKLGFAMSYPLDFGICNDEKSCYMLLSYIEGIDLQEALPSLSERETPQAYSNSNRAE